MIPGAGGAAWNWHLVVPALLAAGHDAVAVQLPAADPKASLPDYARLATDAAAGRDDVVLVAASMGGFTAPLVCERTPVAQVMLVNAMIPVPGEPAGQWWAATGAIQARDDLDAREGRPGFEPETHFGHDVPAHVWAEGAQHQQEESEAAFAQPCDFTDWPGVPIRVLIGRDDRFFPAAFQRRVAQDRLKHRLTSIDEIPGGHLLALAQPGLVADWLLRHTSDGR
jgi:pimeloyl-ACP methyl ester carboxylesterase